MNYLPESANKMIDFYQETIERYQADINKLNKENDINWYASLDMYMYCLRYTFKVIDTYRQYPIQFYKDEIIEMKNRFLSHAESSKDTRLYNLNISIVRYCETAFAEMEKIPTK